MQKQIKFIILMIFLACGTVAFSSQEFAIKAANQLKDITTPLKGSDPTISDDSDLIELDKVIGDARVVVYGIESSFSFRLT